MKKLQYWTVDCTHGGGQYNDPAYYSIIDGNGKKVAEDTDQRLLQRIANQHNLCFIEHDEQKDTPIE